MQFQKGYIYHIYNQGNNKCAIFRERENYLFFLKKINVFILPYCDVLAWCLMPNHFHLMVLVREVQIEINPATGNINADIKNTKTALNEAGQEKSGKLRPLNDSVGILLRSYTRAYNRWHGYSGSLFREETKALCINCPKKMSRSYYTRNGITESNITNPQIEYIQVCFDYIHQNPVKANIVKTITDWEFSSARDYAGLRDGKLVNKSIAGEYVRFLF